MSLTTPVVASIENGVLSCEVTKKEVGGGRWDVEERKWERGGEVGNRR